MVPGNHRGNISVSSHGIFWHRYKQEIASKLRGKQGFRCFPAAGGRAPPLFRCNKKRIADYPNLASYMRDLYQMPGIAETVKARYYVINYWSIARLNPMGIIPKGTPVDYSGPHDRARLAS